jgi:hypothetical protein
VEIIPFKKCESSKCIFFIRKRQLLKAEKVGFVSELLFKKEF